MAIDLLALLVALVAGSIPFSWLLGRFRYGVDLRTIGDHHVGSGNLLHIGGMPAVIAGTILDLLKGAAAVAIVIAITSDEWVVLTAGVLVVVGHVFPPWLSFRGGRGAAPAIGVAWALFPLAGIAMLGVGLVALVSTRRTAVGIAAAVIALVVVAWFVHDDLSRLLFVATLFITVGLKDVFDRLLARPSSG
jgi:glycerol-3-phosphate acyltransferase PlsY